MDPSELKTTAELANLDLTEKELSSLGGELEKTLAFISKMQDADVNALRGHAPAAANRLRRDEPAPDMYPDALLENAPEREDRFIVIPNVL